VSIVNLPLAKEKALNLALNKIQGDWDQDKLATLLEELLQVPDLDFAVTGFEVPDARSLIAEVLGSAQGQQEKFDVEEALASVGPPVTQPGDLIPLGPHRLLCGDSTDPDQVRRLMKGERAAVMATDLPYLVDYTTKHARKGTIDRRLNWDDAAANPDLYRK